MTRHTVFTICILNLLLMSSTAHATLVWDRVYQIGYAYDASSTTTAFNMAMPQYDSSRYGGADLQAVRWDLSSEVYGLRYVVANPNETWASGLVTISNSFQILHPTAPNTVIAEAQQNWSQWMSVSPWTVASGNAPGSLRSTVGIITTNLDPFIGTYPYPAYFGYSTADHSSWVGSENVQLWYDYQAMVVIDMYYGYDDGTPSRTPEPGTLLLMAAGLPALGFIRRKRRSAA